MCGIIAFLGYRFGIKQLYEGLLILQNRGYDSAGICSIVNNKFLLHKFASKHNKTAFEYLEPYINEHSSSFNSIGHSRWGTTGCTTLDANSHPHIDFTNKFSLIHNGIIENYAELKQELMNQNITFKSETDTEVIVNLIGFHYMKGFSINESIEKAIGRLEGTWGLVIQCLDEPNKLYCARHGSPILIGFGEDYIMVASEQSGFAGYVKNYIILNDNNIVELVKKDGKVTFNKMNEASHFLHDEAHDGYKLRKVIDEKIALSPSPFPHWTLKEIHEQFESSIRAMGRGGRILNDKEVKLGGFNSHITELLQLDNLILLGCGTSYHAGLHCLNLFKKISGFNTVQVFDGAEFDLCDIPKLGKTGLILLSQSGETKDLHRCIDIAKNNNLITIGVINVVDSMIARDVNCGVYLNAGKEIAVASTKSFTSQVIVLNLIAIWFAQNRNIHEVKRMEFIKGLRTLPYDIQKVIHENNNKCIEVAKYLMNYNTIFVLGRGDHEAIALEGALKIKEIGYVNCNGYSTASLKHGPYALLDKGIPVILLLPDDNLYARNNSVGDELKSREAFVIAISDKQSQNKYNINITVPKNSPCFGILASVCMQLIAYHLSVLKGNNCDKPRHLCKSVTTD